MKKRTRRLFTLILLVLCAGFVPLAIWMSQVFLPGDERWTVQTQMMGYFFLLILMLGIIIASVKLIQTRKNSL